MVWENALTDLKANVRLTYTKAGIEHDVVLLESPPPPSAFGLPDTCLLEVWHEVVDVLDSALAVQDPTTNGPSVAVSHPQRLVIGSMTMTKGRAFSIGAEADNGGLPALQGQDALVRASLQVIEGRRFLIEAVDYAQIQPELESLPAAPAVVDETASLSGRSPSLAHRVQPQRVFPAAPQRDGRSGPFQIAHAERPERGFVFDYALLNSTANMVLKGDTTYHVSGVVNLTGVTTLEGTVIKFSSGAQLRIAGTLRCLTGPYNPAILTGYDDNTAGETLPGSTGNPWGTYYAANALYFDDNQSDLRYVRILHAQQGVYYDSDTGSPHFLSHAQFLHCQKAVLPYNTTVNVRNALMQDVQTAFYNATYPATAVIEHLTATNITTFRGSSLLTLNVTNSLLVNMTTEAPRVLNGTVSAPLTLAPEVWRDGDVPDIGFHYPALNHLASNVTATAAITLKDGVAVGLAGSAGFYLGVGGSFVSEGTVPDLNRLVNYQTVQEQPQAWNGNNLFQIAGSTTASMQLRLTEISARPGSGLVLLDLYTIQPFSVLGLKDCQVHRGTFGLWPNTSGQVTVGLTNNLFDRCDLGLNHSYYSQNTPIAVYLYNNLHLGGYLRLNYDSSTVSNPAWVARDNLFDGTSQLMAGNAWQTGQRLVSA